MSIDDAVLGTLDLLRGGPFDPVEIRVLLPNGAVFGKRFENHREAAAYVAKYHASAPAIYTLLNPYEEAWIKDKLVDDGAITQRLWLLVDCDPVRDPVKTNATDAELLDAIGTGDRVEAYLADHGFPRPVRARSGNGEHLLYLIELPNTDESKTLIAAILNHLAAIFDTAAVKIDPSVYNASRITKVYGTTVRKGPPSAERPHRDSRIAYRPDPLVRVPTERLYALIGRTLPEESEDVQVIQDRPVVDTVAAVDRVAQAKAWLGNQPQAVAGDHGDQHTYRICAALVKDYALSEDDAFKALREWNARCQPPWDPDDLKEKIAHAAQYGKKPLGNKLQQFPLTEAGDAECFASMYGDIVRYDHRLGRYLLSDDGSGIWIPDPEERLTQMTVAMMRARQHHALTLTDDAKVKAIKWAISGESRFRLTNAQTLARSVPPIADPGDNWDQDPWLLGALNGVVDLRTGAFRKAVPEDRITMRVRVAFDPTATCPLWLQTLADIFKPSEVLTDAASRDLIDFFQRAVGYSITGDCREECCFITWGEGGNGKGTTMNTLGWLLGDYNDDIPPSTLEKSRHGGGIPNDLAKLVGKRFITCSEVNEFTLNEARLKAMTGRDPITARFLHHEFFSFIPVGKPWLSTNKKPRIDSQDDGIWRRIHLIPFMQSFVGSEKKKLKDQLRGELAGILNWAIAGALRWQRDGLQPPEIVRVATKAYREESHPLAPFLDACCEIGSDDQLCMQAGPAFTEYESFCRDLEIERWRQLSSRAFHKAMRLKFKVDDSGRHLFYLGVRLRQTLNY